MKRIIVGVTGASGSIYAVKLLELLAGFDAEMRIIFSDTAKQVVLHETGYSAEQIAEKTAFAAADRDSRASVVMHDNSDIAAPPASGSFRADSMVIIPCSMACAGRIASCSGRNLIERAADVTLKEGRPLVLAVRETPLNLIHLRNLASLSEAGAVIFPAMPSFYGKPGTIGELASVFSARVLDRLGFRTEYCREWNGYEKR